MFDSGSMGVWSVKEGMKWDGDVSAGSTCGTGLAALGDVRHDS